MKVARDELLRYFKKPETLVSLASGCAVLWQPAVLVFIIK